jgi:hypothetical protein
MSEYFEIAKAIQDVAVQGIKSGQEIADRKYRHFNTLLEFAKRHHEVCEDCEGTGRLYKHADPTSMQWIECPYAKAIEESKS